MFFADKPLVLDLTRLLPGPYGTFLMASFGIEVIKIEDKGKGDYLKTLTATVEGEDSLLYRLFNDDKKKLFLDLPAPGDRQVFLELVAKAHVLIESFRPGVMERMNLGYDTLKGQNPKIIYINIGGHLDKSPKADLAGHDLNYMAESGILGCVGKDKPEIIGAPLADLAGGLALFGVAAAALYRQRGTGEGMYLKLGIDELMKSWGNISSAFFGRPEEYPGLGKGLINGGMLCYNIYQVKDGYIALAALEAKFWDKFVKVINQPDLKPGQFTEPVPENPYFVRLSAFFKNHTRQAILALMEHADCCLSPVLTPGEVVPEEEELQRVKCRDFLEYKTTG